jgi:hypothetical protein
MNGSTSGFGDWFSNLFGSSSGNAAGLGFSNSDAAWAEQPAGQLGPLSQDQIARAQAGAGTTGEQTALGMNAKQWNTASQLFGSAAKGMDGQQAAAQQPQQMRGGAGQGLHQGNPAAFNSLLTQILQRRAAGQPGAATAPPPGLMGASRG